jgi:hypothetical protein
MGLPAPYEFLLFFKVLGFILHAIPMNVVEAGMFLVLLLRWRGGEPGVQLAERLGRQMPVIIALAVNLGIVPLLFTQALYYRVFYPATILMAWSWLSVILLLLTAYYGVYVYSVAQRRGTLRPWKTVLGWVSAALFLVIGLLFSSALSLMTDVERWPGLWQSTSVAAAPLGTGHHFTLTVWLRWLMMFGLALTTTAVYVVVDAGWFGWRQTEAYRRWAARFAWRLHALGCALFLLASAGYVLGAWPVEVRERMFSWPWSLLTGLTPAGLAWPAGLLLLQARRGAITRSTSSAAGVAQVVVIVFNAVSRQVVQNLELARFVDLASAPVRTQWSPLVLFLALFLAGLALLAWMLRQVLSAERRSGAA